MKIYPIVEGYGEVEAVPVLLRRLIAAASAFDFTVAKPHRRPRSEIINGITLKKAVQIVLKNGDCGAVLVILDADDDCPKEAVPKMEDNLKSECRTIPSGVVMANREFEAWFLANTEHWGGAPFIGDPEVPRNAKEAIEQLMGPKYFYNERTDQPSFAARMDLVAAYRKCRSFKKLTSIFGRMLTAGSIATEWPPANWYDAQAGA